MVSVLPAIELQPPTPCIAAGDNKKSSCTATAIPRLLSTFTVLSTPRKGCLLPAQRAILITATSASDLAIGVNVLSLIDRAELMGLLALATNVRGGKLCSCPACLESNDLAGNVSSGKG